MILTAEMHIAEMKGSWGGGKGWVKHVYEKEHENDFIEAIQGTPRDVYAAFDTANRFGKANAGLSITLNPSQFNSDEDFQKAREIVAEIIGFDLQEAIVVRHGKQRNSDNVADTHEHLFIPLVDNATGKNRFSSSYYIKKCEAAARAFELISGEELTMGAHNHTAFQILLDNDNICSQLDLTDEQIANIRKIVDPAIDRPVASMTKAQREAAKKNDFDLVSLKTQIKNKDMNTILQVVSDEIAKGKIELWYPDDKDICTIRDVDTGTVYGNMTRLSGVRRVKGKEWKKLFEDFAQNKKSTADFVFKEKEKPENYDALKRVADSIVDRFEQVKLNKEKNYEQINNRTEQRNIDDSITERGENTNRRSGDEGSDNVRRVDGSNGADRRPIGDTDAIDVSTDERSANTDREAREDIDSIKRSEQAADRRKHTTTTAHKATKYINVVNLRRAFQRVKNRAFKRLTEQRKFVKAIDTFKRQIAALRRSQNDAIFTLPKDVKREQIQLLKAPKINADKLDKLKRIMLEAKRISKEDGLPFLVAYEDAERFVELEIKRKLAEAKTKNITVNDTKSYTQDSLLRQIISQYKEPKYCKDFELNNDDDIVELRAALKDVIEKEVRNDVLNDYQDIKMSKRKVENEVKKRLPLRVEQVLTEYIEQDKIRKRELSDLSYIKKNITTDDLYKIIEALKSDDRAIYPTSIRTCDTICKKNKIDLAKHSPTEILEYIIIELEKTERAAKIVDSSRYKFK